MIQEWEWQTAKRMTFRGTFCEPEPFASIDPGGDGAVLIWRHPLSPWPHIVLPLPGHANDRTAADEIAATGVRLVVIEAQYHHKNARTALKLARRAGMLLGSISYPTADLRLRVVFVPPGSWQTVLGKQRRGRTKELAMAMAAADFGADSRYTRASKSIKSGIADALGMARWWRAEMSWPVHAGEEAQCAE